MTANDYKFRASKIKEAIRYHKQRLAALDIAIFKLNDEAREQIMAQAKDETPNAMTLMLEDR